MGGVVIELDVETARTEYNSAGAEVRHAQTQLDNAVRALVDAAENYGAAVSRYNEEPQ
jgi:outer membrane protein TolC